MSMYTPGCIVLWGESLLLYFPLPPPPFPRKSGCGNWLRAVTSLANSPCFDLFCRDAGVRQNQQHQELVKKPALRPPPLKKGRKEPPLLHRDDHPLSLLLTSGEAVSQRTEPPLVTTTDQRLPPVQNLHQEEKDLPPQAKAMENLTAVVANLQGQPIKFPAVTEPIRLI